MAARHKFRAIATKRDEMHFSSRLEARYYDKMKILQSSGELLFFLRQVPVHLPGGVKYVVDFVEFWADGEVKFTDCKGMETKDFISKKKIVESLYPFTINVVKDNN